MLYPYVRCNGEADTEAHVHAFLTTWHANHVSECLAVAKENASKMVELGLSLDGQAATQGSIRHALSSPNPPSSWPAHRSPSPSRSQPALALPDSGATMLILIISVLGRWLHDRKLAGFIKVSEVPPHLDSLEMATKINVTLNGG